MPTVGWIQETAWNRHTDAFPFTSGGKPEPILCPLCRKAFADRAALSSHLGIDHPLKLPMLRIGTEIGLTKYIVRDSSVWDDIETYSTNGCSLVTNGSTPKTIQRHRLATHLKSAGNAQHRLTLRNDRVVDGRQAESEIEVSVLIPDEAVIRAVDNAFLKELAVDRPTMRDVDRFLRVVPVDIAAADYAGALADYVVGMLIKEQDRTAGTVAGFDTFKDKFGSARRVLLKFRSRVARAVVATIDFNLNHFVHEATTTVPALQAAHRFLGLFSATGGIPAAGPKAESEQTMVPACPVDKVTAAILATLTKFPDVEGYDDPAPSLPALGNAPLSEYDLAKIGTLKAGAAMLMGQKAAAIHHLHRVEHDYHFGAWAITQLKNLANHE